MLRSSLVALSLAAVASACASANRTIEPGTEQAINTTRVVGSDNATRSITGVVRTESVKSEVFAPPQQVWEMLPEVYQALGIDIASVIQEEKRIGNDAFRTRRKVADMPMQRLLDCGGAAGTPNAETFEITMSVFSVVTGSGDRSAVATTLSATARSPSFGGASDILCTSTGRLERRIDELVKARLALAK